MLHTMVALLGAGEMSRWSNAFDTGVPCWRRQTSPCSKFSSNVLHNKLHSSKSLGPGSVRSSNQVTRSDGLISSDTVISLVRWLRPDLDAALVLAGPYGNGLPPSQSPQEQHQAHSQHPRQELRYSNDNVSAATQQNEPRDLPRNIKSSRKPLVHLQDPSLKPPKARHLRSPQTITTHPHSPRSAPRHYYTSPQPTTYGRSYGRLGQAFWGLSQYIYSTTMSSTRHPAYLSSLHT